MTKKPQQKLKYLENEKSFQDQIKSISIIFKGLSMKQITQFFWEGEGPTLRISSVNATKFAVSCGFGRIYWKKSLMENFIFCVV